VKQILAIMLGILTAIGGFMDIGCFSITEPRGLGSSGGFSVKITA
jgi:hypothetical protein